MGAAEKTEPEQEWFTTEEAAAFLRMTGNAIRKHVCSGRLRPDVFGKRGRTRSHRFSRATLRAFFGGPGGKKEEG